MADAAPRDRRPLVAGVASALVVLVFFAWFVTFGPGRWRGVEPSAMEAMASQTGAQASKSPVTVSSLPAGSPPAPVAPVGTVEVRLSEADALAKLKQTSADSATSIKIQGQWVAQLASKFVGVVDAQQTTASGSHKFAAVDIWAEYVSLQSFATDVRVGLLNSTTFGTGKNNAGEPYYVTVAFSDDFTSADKIIAWCAARFPQLTGTALNNRCLATQLTPLGG